MVVLSVGGLESGSHITRYHMHEHLARVLASEKGTGSGDRILSISGSEELSGLIPVENTCMIRADYPEYNALDLPFADEEFDWVVCGQVLEHIEGDPRRVTDEMHRVLKPGGTAVLTTCFINPIHKYPKDLWRFSPDALRFLFRDFTAVLDAGGWGNFYVWTLVWLGLRTLPIPHAEWHPLHKLATLNDENWPIVTWIVARK